MLNLSGQMKLPWHVEAGKIIFNDSSRDSRIQLILYPPNRYLNSELWVPMLSFPQFKNYSYVYNAV